MLYLLTSVDDEYGHNDFVLLVDGPEGQDINGLWKEFGTFVRESTNTRYLGENVRQVDEAGATEVFEAYRSLGDWISVRMFEYINRPGLFATEMFVHESFRNWLVQVKGFTAPLYEMWSVEECRRSDGFVRQS